MYLEYWGFNTTPFMNVPSEDLFFESPQHEEAINRLLYVVNYRQGVAMLTGEVGCGKTTVAKNLKNHLPEGKFNIQMLTNPALSPTDFIRAILLSFNVSAKTNAKSILIDELSKKISSYASQGGGAVLIIDEAHVINSKKVMEELRMLLNLQYNNQFLLTLIMLGQPPLLDKINAIQPLKERISMKYNLPPLDITHTEDYVLFRTQRAGAANGLFTKNAIALIHNYASGIPLRINNLCDRCFLIGMMQKGRQINSEIVKQSIADLK